MEAARLPRQLRVPPGQLALIGLLLVLAGVGWAVTDGRMEGMDAGPGTDPGALGFYAVTWVVMMAAMMFPSIWPMVLAQRAIERGRRARGREVAAATTTLFVAGYLVSWLVFGLAAYGLLELIRSFSIDAFSWDRGGPYLAGGVIVVAALYQLTPAKDTCLVHCRSPFDFLTEHWRNGRLGALRMGVIHGSWCVGCCWALMAALFALGVMSLGWMAFVSALIAIEKLSPWKALANRSIALLLLVLGIAVAAVPDRVPGLVLPDSPEAGAAMQRMEGGSGMGMSKDRPGAGMSGKPGAGMSGKPAGAMTDRPAIRDRRDAMDAMP
jgi:predicted metal-binding membrane protein